MLYRVYEKENVNSTREPSFIYNGSLTGAKRKASSEKSFHGTVIVIETDNGDIVATKRDGKRWTDL